MSVDFQFPDNLYRVVLCDFSVFVFFFSTSKYTEDFPYILAFGTALVEYMLLSTWLTHLITSMTCGFNPFAIGLIGLNYAIFIIGTAFNLSRSVWALYISDAGAGATMYDLIPGRTHDLDTLWWSTAIAVTLCLLFCSYTTSRRAHQLYTPVPPSRDDTRPARRTCLCC